MLTATATEASSKEPRKPHCEPPIFSVLRTAPGPGSPDLAAEARQRSPSGTLTVSAATSDPLQGRPPTRGGRLAACRFFFHYELPKIGAWLGVVERRDDTCRTMAEDWF